MPRNTMYVIDFIFLKIHSNLIRVNTVPHHSKATQMERGCDLLEARVEFYCFSRQPTRFVLLGTSTVEWRWRLRRLTHDCMLCHLFFSLFCFCSKGMKNRVNGTVFFQYFLFVNSIYIFIFYHILIFNFEESGLCTMLNNKIAKQNMSYFIPTNHFFFLIYNISMLNFGYICDLGWQLVG